jgi:hypothetical protein
MKWVFLRHEVNQGKAAAIRTALQSATAELAVTHDADLEYHPLDPNESGCYQSYVSNAGAKIQEIDSNGELPR